MDMKRKRCNIFLIMCLIGGIVYVIYTYILPLFESTTFEFDVNDVDYHYKSGYDAFYESPDIVNGEKFDIILKRFEKVDGVEKGQVKAEILIIGKTDTIYEAIDITAMFAITLESDLEKRLIMCDVDPICNFYLEDYGKEAGWDKYRLDVSHTSHYYLEYKGLDDIGPLLMKFHYDFNQNGDELYDLMKSGYVVVYDQDKNIIDAIPFDFTDIIDNQ